MPDFNRSELDAVLYKWLGIPPTERPLNHYRLLGVTLFEQDADVISSAADRQMGHVRTFQSGQQAELSQRILNEIAAAKICLLTPAKKAAYDAALQARLAGQSKAGQSRSGAQAKAAGQSGLRMAAAIMPVDDDPLGLSTPSSAPAMPAKTIKRSKPAPSSKQRALKSSAMIVGVLSAAACSVGVVFMVAKMLQNDNREAIEANLHSADQHPVARADISQQHPPQTAPTPAPPGDSDTARPRPVSPNVNGSNTRSLEPEPAEVRPVQPATPKTPATPNDTPKTSPSGNSKSQHNRQPIPDSAALATAQKGIRDLFAKDMAAATTKPAKAALADKLLRTAVETKDNPADQYSLFTTAHDLAIGAGDLSLALRCVDQLSEQYEIGDDGRWKLVVDAFTIISKPDPGALAEQALARINQAIAEDRFAEARKIAASASDAARRAKDTATAVELEARKKDIERIESAFADQVKAQKTLESHADDPAANFAVGQYLCCIKGQWELGLPHLTKCGDAGWRAAAATDLASPTGADAQYDLAEAWRQLAGQSETYKSQLNERATLWYRKALPNLTGLRKAGAEKYIAKEGPVSPAEPGSAFVVGFVEESKQFPLPTDDIKQIVTVEVLKLEGFPERTKMLPGAKASGTNALRIVLRADEPKAEIRLQITGAGAKRVLKIAPVYLPLGANPIPLTSERLATAQKTLPELLKSARGDLEKANGTVNSLQTKLSPLLDERARFGGNLSPPSLMKLNAQINGFQTQLNAALNAQRRLDRSIGQMQHNLDLLPDLSKIISTFNGAKIHVRVYSFADGRETELLRLE